jgi:hypothetical protein
MNNGTLQASLSAHHSSFVCLSVHQKLEKSGKSACLRQNLLSIFERAIKGERTKNKKIIHTCAF